MELHYKNKQTEKICTDEKKAIKSFGKEVANKLLAVIILLECSLNLKDVLAFKQYNLHPLKGNLKGFHSIYLGKTTGYRLLLMPLDENKQPIKNTDTNIYASAVCVKIEGVTKHYE